jgi:hypothetical protein
MTTSTIDFTAALRALADHIEQYDLVAATAYTYVRTHDSEARILTTDGVPGFLRWLSTVDVDDAEAQVVGVGYHIEVDAHVGELRLELAHVCDRELSKAIHSAGLTAGALPEGDELLTLVRAAVAA